VLRPADTPEGIFRRVLVTAGGRRRGALGRQTRLD